MSRVAGARRRRLVAASIALVIGASGVAPARGDSKTGKQKINGGSLEVTSTAIALPQHTLTGEPVAIVGAAASEWVAKDARGTGGAWSVTLSASGPFISEAGSVETTARTIPIGSAQFEPGTAAAGSSSDVPTNLTLTALTLSTSAQTFLSCSQECKGKYSFTPNLSLTVPANAYRSNYSAAVGASPINPYNVTLILTIS